MEDLERRVLRGFLDYAVVLREGEVEWGLKCPATLPFHEWEAVLLGDRVVFTKAGGVVGVYTIEELKRYFAGEVERWREWASRRGDLNALKMLREGTLRVYFYARETHRRTPLFTLELSQV